LNSKGGLTELLLIIAGTMGAGKTSVLGEASDILAMGQITHAAIDVDALGLAHLPAGACNDAVMYVNLRSVCKNYAALGVQRFLLALGVQRFLLARAIEDRAQLVYPPEIICGMQGCVNP
jgi:hypothetical protein